MIVDFSIAHGCVAIGVLTMLEGLLSLFSKFVYSQSMEAKYGRLAEMDDRMIRSSRFDSFIA